METHVIEALKAGGFVPVAEDVWQQIYIGDCDQLIVMGVPAETLTPIAKGQDGIALVAIPLVLTKAPLLVSYRQEFMRYARLLQSDSDQFRTQNLEGMSGGPIFGIKHLEEERRYWLVGVQSGWFANDRIVSFCPITAFLQMVKAGDIPLLD